MKTQQIHPEMKPFKFTIEGTVFAANESHANHFVYWTMEKGIQVYGANSDAYFVRWTSDAIENEPEDKK